MFRVSVWYFRFFFLHLQSRRVRDVTTLRLGRAPLVDTDPSVTLPSPFTSQAGCPAFFDELAVASETALAWSSRGGHVRIRKVLVDEQLDGSLVVQGFDGASQPLLSSAIFQPRRRAAKAKPSPCVGPDFLALLEEEREVAAAGPAQRRGNQAKPTSLADELAAELGMAGVVLDQDSCYPISIKRINRGSAPEPGALPLTR